MKKKLHKIKENLKDRLAHDENAWGKLGEQLASQTKNVYGQLADIFTLLTRVQDAVENLEKRIFLLETGKDKNVGN